MVAFFATEVDDIAIAKLLWKVAIKNGHNKRFDKKNILPIIFCVRSYFSWISFVVLCCLPVSLGAEENHNLLVDSAVMTPVETVEKSSSETTPPEFNLEKSVAKMLAYLAILATMGFYIAHLKRKGGIFKSAKKDSRIRIAETLSLGSKHYLAVVECETQRFLVGVSSSGIQAIGELRESKKVPADVIQQEGKAPITKPKMRMRSRTKKNLEKREN